MPTSKPTNIDAQRILAVMDELKEKLTYLSVCTPQVLQGLQSEEGQATQELVGPELMKVLQEQMKLEELYVMANAAADHNFDQREDGEDPMREEEASLKKNTLELCRKMREKQRLVANLSSELRNFQERDSTRNVYQFLHTLNDMQELTLKRLTTTVEEERSRTELLETYKTKEAEASKRRQHLEKDLNTIRREGERAQSQRTQILTKLRAELLDVKDTSAERMTGLRSRYDTRMKEYEAAFEAKEKKMNDEITKLREQNKKSRVANEDDELGQKGKAKRYEMDVESVIKDYDTKVKDMAFQLGERTDLYNKEKKQMQELSDHFKKVDEEKGTIDREEAISNARTAKREMEAERRKKSSALVQAFWRGIIQREAYGIMKKAKKKKGGKKKK